MIFKNFKEQIKDPLLIGIVLLQFCVFSLFGSWARRGSFSLEQASDAIVGASLSQGNKIPHIAAYDSLGNRQLVTNPKRLSMVILATSCNCESLQIQSWAETALQRGDDVTVVVSTTPGKLRQSSGQLPPNVHLLAMRSIDFLNLSEAVEHTPVAIRVRPDGTVLSTHWR